MRRLALVTALAVAAATATATAVAGSDNDWPALLRSIPEAARLAENLESLTAAPHVAGSVEDEATAKFVLERFRGAGLDAHVETENVLLTLPGRRSVTLLAGNGGGNDYEAPLDEPVVEGDPFSGDPRIVPTFNAYSASGDVTAPLVYANYGSLDDFRALAAAGVDVRGKLVLCRYGQLFRGTKVMIAEMFGALGVIIYSDPADDGYARGRVYPDGPWRPQWSVQRGSAQFLSLCAGDPRQPECGFANYTDGLPSVPVQPISWGAAVPLLAAVAAGPKLPGFAGALPNVTYRAGPSAQRVRLAVESNFRVAPTWSVVAEVKGSGGDAAGIVLLSNHRDAWTFGAVDPNSGTSVLLETARAFGIMLERGWRPLRTIRLCSWDAEEYGLLGSSAYASRHAAELSAHAVAFLNIDSAVSGPNFNAGATPSLADAVRAAAANTTDPKTGKPVLDVWGGDVRILGSGSDYVAFLDRLGIPSTDTGFGGPYGVYHSAYDNYAWMSRFGDPDFVYHRAATQFFGQLALSVADGPLAKRFNFTHYAHVFGSQLAALRERVPRLDYRAAAAAVGAFARAADEHGARLPDPAVMRVERALLGPGLPKRKYFKHVFQAPALMLGYGAGVFPGVDDALVDDDYDAAQQQLGVIASAANAAARVIRGDDRT